MTGRRTPSLSRTCRPAARVLALVLASAGTPALAGPSGGWLANAPILVRLGPYGSPFAMTPGASLFGSDGQLAPGERSAARPATPSRAERAADPLTRAATADEDDGTIPAKPGTFSHERIKAPEAVPNMSSRPQRTPKALTPDFEIPLGRRAALGAFTDFSRVELETRAGHLPSVRTLEAGAGLTFQYRFGE